MPTTQTPLITVKKASKTYRMGEVNVHALRDASIEVFDGEFLIVVGPSGSGKSTLLNLIGGLDQPSTGTMRFLDRDLSSASEAELTIYRRSQIGFIFQFFNLIPTLTALENIQTATELASDPMNPDEALKLVGLSGRADHFPSQLSGGEQQRVSIARAIASNPRLLLCDEPTGALDLETSRSILSILHGLNREQGKTVVLITHNNAFTSVGDRVAVMRDGTIRSIDVNQQPIPPGQIQW